LATARFLRSAGFLDALQGDQRIDCRDRAQRTGRGGIARRLLLADGEGAAGADASAVPFDP
jgi:hypothetical protein